MLTEGDSNLGGEHTMQHTYDALLNCMLEAYMLLCNKKNVTKYVHMYMFE